MARLTVLDIVQKMLNDTSGDEVNSITDTTESQQMAVVVEDSYLAMMSKGDWRHLRQMTQLEGLSDTNKPNYLKIPVAVKEIESTLVKYDKIKAGDTRKQMRPVKYMNNITFLNLVDGRDETRDNIIEVVDFDNTTIHIRNDKAPEFWTTFDDVHLIFDSFDVAVETTLQTSKNKVLVSKLPTFSKIDTHIPDIPEEQMAQLLAVCKDRASVVSRQIQDSQMTQEATEQARWGTRKAWVAKGGIITSDFGRRGNKSRAPVLHRNPLIGKD